MNVFSHFMKLKYANLILLVGVTVGFTVAAGFLPGGYDGIYYFLMPRPDNSLVPAWVFFVTTPFSLLKYPMNWQLLVFVTIISAGFCAFLWNQKRWWIVVFSAPMLWNIWLGQIELFTLAGLIVAWIVLNKNISPFWLGIAWLGLLVKPQVGLGPILIIMWWIWRDRGIKSLLLSCIPTIFIFGISLFIWKDWLINWLMSVRASNPTPTWVAAIWPYGLLAIPFAIIPKNITREKRLRMIAAATLLASPYFTLYHCTTLLALTPSILSLVLSWLLVFPALAISDSWRTFSWILPAVILLVDFVRCYIPVKNLAVDAA